MSARIDRASSGVRPVPAEMLATDSSVIGVSTYPGQTALTVTPVRATSAAAVRTRPSTPCLLAVYAAIRAPPRLAGDRGDDDDPAPARRRSSPGSARRRQRNGAVRLRSSIRCQSSSEVFTSGADIAAPALTTSTSTGPHVASTVANAASSAAGSVTSVGSTSASPGQRVGDLVQRRRRSRATSATR